MSDLFLLVCDLFFQLYFLSWCYLLIFHVTATTTTIHATISHSVFAFRFRFVSFHSSWFCAAILFVVLCSSWVIRTLFRSLYSLIGLSSNLFIFIYMYLVASSVRGVLCVRILNILFRYIVFLISLWLTRLAVGWASHNEIRLIWETTYGIYAKVRCEEKNELRRYRGRSRRERTKTTKLTQCVCGWESVSMNMYVSIYT